jgi:glycosyltransferase involved in cell wall biosynthesis
MQILYFYQYFTVPQGSYGTRVYEMAKRWVKQGDTVTVITSVYDKSGLAVNRPIEKVQIEGIQVVVVNIGLSSKHGFTRRILSFLGYALMGCWYAVTLPGDVVVVSVGPITAGLPGLVSRLFRGRPFVLEVRDIWLESAIQLGVVRNWLLIVVARAFDRFCCRAASKVVALSPGMADWLARNYSVTSIAIVTNGSDNEFFGKDILSQSLMSWGKGSRLAVYTGAIGAMNDCWQIVKMAEVLQARRNRVVRIVLVGDGKDRPALEAYARSRGLGNIEFLGNRAKSEVAAWLKSARCALLAFKNVPALDTVSPNKMFDAFAAGTPIIQSTRGWIRGLVAEERCGMNVPPEDPEALADAVEKVCRDDALYLELSANALRLARTRFDRDLLAGNMRAALEEAIGLAR